MIYLKLFILYSFLGFTFESMIFKISNSNKHSGILYGPLTTIYGFGALLSILINNILSIIDNFILNYIISYLCFTIICTIIEYIGGNLIKLIFDVDMWDYSNHKYHLDKYICLDYALVWGLLAIIFIKLFNNYFYQILNLIPNYYAIIILSTIIIDYIIKIIIKKDYFSK